MGTMSLAEADIYKRATHVLSGKDGYAQKDENTPCSSLMCGSCECVTAVAPKSIPIEEVAPLGPEEVGHSHVTYVHKRIHVVSLWRFLY